MLSSFFFLSWPLSSKIFLLQHCVETLRVLTQKPNTRMGAPKGPSGGVVNVAPAEKDIKVLLI